MMIQSVDNQLVETHYERSSDVGSAQTTSKKTNVVKLNARAATQDRTFVFPKYQVSNPAQEL